MLPLNEKTNKIKLPDLIKAMRDESNIINN